MTAMMVVLMDILDDAWLAPYRAAVPAILEAYGGRPIGGSLSVERLEGTAATPDRVAVLRFPDVETIHRFMADAEYQPYRAMREGGSRSTILIFENAVPDGELT